MSYNAIGAKLRKRVDSVRKVVNRFVVRGCDFERLRLVRPHFRGYTDRLKRQLLSSDLL